MDIKLFSNLFRLNRKGSKDAADKNSIDPALIKEKICFADDVSQKSALKGRVYPLGRSGFENFFFAETPQEQQKLIANLEAIFVQILPKIRIPFFSGKNVLEFNGFFAEIEKIVCRYDSGAKVYLGGGSIRSILSFIYKELLDAKNQGLDPAEVLENFANGSRKFSAENEKGEISPMHVLGVESDIDIYIEFSDDCNCKDAAIHRAKEFINRGIHRVNHSPLKDLVFPPADVKEYKDQMQRASSNGGSALDWVVFPVSMGSAAHFKTPQKCPHVLQSLCKGTLPYYPVDSAEIPAVTTLRVYRSLLELPFLDLEKADHNRFVEDLKKVVPALKDADIKNRVDQVFRKIVRNTRFPDRVNLEVQKNSSLQHPEKDALQKISKLFVSGKNVGALPELLPNMVNTTNLDIDLIRKFNELNLFMSTDAFIQNHTDKGVLYHGTPDLKNLSSMIRGNLFVSNQRQGNAACGRGFYSTKSVSVAKQYSGPGFVIPFEIKVDALKVIDLQSIPKTLLKELEKKANQKGIDVNEYLATYMQVDIVVNEHVLLQNGRVFCLNKTQEQFLVDAFYKDFERAIEYFKQFEYTSLDLSDDQIQTFAQMFKFLDNFSVLLGLIDKNKYLDFKNSSEPVIEKALDYVYKIASHNTCVLTPFCESFLVNNDRSFILTAVKGRGNALRYASDRLKDDKGLVLEAVKQDGWALGYASERLKDDKEVVLEALRQGGFPLGYASERLRDDKEMVLKALRQGGFPLVFASDRLKDDKEVVLEALRQGGFSLGYASDRLKDDKEIVLAAVKQTRWALEYASDRLKDDKEVVLAAVKQYGGVLWCASERLKDDKEIVLEAIKRNWQALEDASDRIKEDKELVLEAVKQDGEALRCASNRLKDDKEIVLEAIKRNWQALEYASDRIKEDKEIVLEAVKQDGEALRRASNRLKDNKEFVLELIKESPSVLRYASNRLKDDREIVLEAVKQSGGDALEYASDRLKDNKEFVLELIKESPSVLRYASDRLKDDKEVVLAAVKKIGWALEYASDRLKDDEKFVLEAIKRNWQALEYASSRLKGNKKFMLQVEKLRS